ncbi:hypothetical protein QZH41_000138 [Actinostola sp. cb2023]|nr:hypothetical protein QZH41_000138 [Actinostola sp. cb2023]
MAKKYAKFLDPDHEVKTFRWPYWLLPLLFLSLLLVLGLFIFITIHSTDRFGCFFNCDRKIDDGGVPVPDDVVVPFEQRRGELNTTEGLPKAISQRKHGQGSPKQDQIIVCGKITFSDPSKIPKALPSNSHLEVKFLYNEMQDAASTTIAFTEVDLLHYKKGTVLKYEIKCPRPEPGHYDVSAVLNMGWKKNGDDWIEKDDYFTDTNFMVKITKDTTIFEKDIDLVLYT